MKRIALIVIVIAAGMGLSACKGQQTVPMEGDIVFHESTSRQSPIIKLAQNSRWTHCGIVFNIGSDAFVYEAVEPVKYTPLKEWIARGKDGYYIVKRLKKYTLSTSQIDRMKTVGLSFKGKHYDKLFQWNDDRMYCSELVWKIYSKGASIELCKPKQFSDFPIDIPRVRKLIMERYGDSFDPSEQIVSPQDLFKSKLLTEIHYKPF